MVDVLGCLHSLGPYDLFRADKFRGINSSGMGIC